MEGQRRMGKNAFGEGQRSFLRYADAKRCACANQLLRLIGEKHVDVATVGFIAEIGVADGQ